MVLMAVSSWHGRVAHAARAGRPCHISVPLRSLAAAGALCHRAAGGVGDPDAPGVFFAWFDFQLRGPRGLGLALLNDAAGFVLAASAFDFEFVFGPGVCGGDV